MKYEKFIGASVLNVPLSYALKAKNIKPAPLLPDEVLIEKQ